ADGRRLRLRAGAGLKEAIEADGSFGPGRLAVEADAAILPDILFPLEFAQVSQGELGIAGVALHGGLLVRVPEGRIGNAMDNRMADGPGLLLGRNHGRTARVEDVVPDGGGEDRVLRIALDGAVGALPEDVVPDDGRLIREDANAALLADEEVVA